LSGAPARFSGPLILRLARKPVQCGFGWKPLSTRRWQP
jgi:hypothetical protein